MDRVAERLDLAEKAQATLFAALNNTALPPIERRDVCILRFVYTFEATWKAAQAVLRVRHGIVANSPRAVVRDCVAVDILDEATGEGALHMVDHRNLVAHIYKEALAEDIWRDLPAHAAALQAWLAGLKAV